QQQQQQQPHLQQLAPPQAIPSAAYRSQAVPTANQQVSTYAPYNLLASVDATQDAQNAPRSSFRRYNVESSATSRNASQQYRVMQGMAPDASGAVGIDQMQQLSAVHQHPIQAMVPQHQASVQQSMAGYIPGMAQQPSQPGMHVSSQAMMYSQQPVRKVGVPPSDRVLRSNSKATSGMPVSGGGVLPAGGHPVQPRYRPGSRDDGSGNPGSYTQFGAPR
ncbi:hypothetical protein LPJ56_005334, partial [Coemansia sp. RSA 2599]